MKKNYNTISKSNLIKLIRYKSSLIEYIENPDEEIQLLAVSDNGYNIRFINDPSDKIKLAAIKRNPYPIKYIKNPTKKAKRFASGFEAERN